MSVAAILAPLFALVALALILLFMLGPMRFRAVSRGEAGPDGALDPRAFPVGVRKVSNSFANQFEVPVLFYVLTTLALFTRKADLVFVILAWVFVISRYVHAYVHVTSNNVKLRFPAFTVGVFVLLAMWVLFALAILLNL